MRKRAAAAAASGTEQNYLLSEASSSTTGTTVSSWAQLDDDIVATLTGAGTATYSPRAAAPPQADYVEWALRDPLGNPTAVELEDVISVLLRVRKYLPTDAFALVVLTSGGLAAAGGGMAAGFRHSASGNLAIDSTHAGSVWDAVTEALAAEGVARLAHLSVSQSNGITAARVAATPLDGGLRPATAANTTTAPGVSNVETGGKFTHVALVVGWADIGGTNGAQAVLGVSGITEPNEDVPDRRALVESTPAGVSGVVSRVAFIGNSQVGTGGSGVDADRGLGGTSYTPVPGSISFSKLGTIITDWAGECASRPYFCDELVAQPGWVSGWVEWFGSDGLAMNPPGAWRALLGDLFLSIAARDDGDPQLIVVAMSENDCQDLVEAGLYLDSLRDALRAIRFEYPDVRILLWQCSDCDTGGSYPYRDTVRAHQATIVAEYDDCELVSAVGAPLSGDVHYSTGTGGGHATMAVRTGALLTA